MLPASTPTVPSTAEESSLPMIAEVVDEHGTKFFNCRTLAFPSSATKFSNDSRLKLNAASLKKLHRISQSHCLSGQCHTCVYTLCMSHFGVKMTKLHKISKSKLCITYYIPCSSKLKSTSKIKPSMIIQDNINIGTPHKISYSRKQARHKKLFFIIIQTALLQCILSFSKYLFMES